MKKILTLLVILFFPALIYIYFAMGIPKVMRAPIYGPRHTVEITDEDGTKKIDTAYYAIPAFSSLTSGGLLFDTHKRLDGRSYVAIFVPPDSIKSMFTILAQDIKLNRASYNYARFIFILQTDSTGNVPVNAPDMANDLLLGTDTAFTLFVRPEKFDTLQQQYFVHDPDRKTDPWTGMTDAVLVDRLSRIRGYYNIHSAADVKRMKEDVNHILMRDEGVQTLEESKVEQKR
jgi:hypothetical protein